jgi:hypothetical protein
MNRVYWMVVFCGLWLGCGFLMQAARGELHTRIKNASCVIIVQPQTCAAVGRSVCLKNYKDPPVGCNGHCAYCDSTTDLPSGSCVGQEGGECKRIGDMIDCGKNNQLWRGTCGGEKCDCINPQTMETCAVGYASWPCSG